MLTSGQADEFEIELEYQFSADVDVDCRSDTKKPSQNAQLFLVEFQYSRTLKRIEITGVE